MQIKKKIKQLLCKHKNTKEIWEYENNFKYNRCFEDAYVTRTKELVCKDCGKKVSTMYAELIFFDQLKEELKNKKGDD